MNTESRMGWMFGFYLLTGALVLASIFGIWHVEEKTSYGLKDVLEILKTLLTFWAGWKFSRPGAMDSQGDKDDAAGQ